MICSVCHQEKGDAFQPRYRRCNACREEGQRQRNLRKPRIRWAIRLKHLYGLTVSEYEEKLRVQGNMCPICQRKFSDEVKPNVDHVHDATRKVRGLLCHRCNVFLGYIEKSKDAVPNALAYLKKWA